MSEDRGPIHLTVQRFAVLTCLVALLPISVGALVTTLKAGMAFADWPTSDGQNMLLYPWLQDLRNTDKFVEHGHRLAGILIGLVSIALVVVTFVREKRSWVRTWAVIILLAVVAQGLLGGMRVRMNAQVLAMIHSVTGGLFFTLCFLFATLVRRGNESDSAGGSDCRITPAAFATGIVLPFAILCQYILGGYFRHLGRLLHEHVAGAVIVSAIVVTLLAFLLRSELASLRHRGRWLGLALFVQLVLGVGSWVTKLGVPAFGWVATMNSLSQNIICSLHTVGGMFLLATASAAAMELLMRARAGQIAGVSDAFGAAISPGRVAMPSESGTSSEGGLG